MLKDLVKRNRSYRRFFQDHAISVEELRKLVDLARLAPSAANRQPLKYILSADPDKNSVIFPFLAWAAYLKEWPGPDEGERPSAYIVMLADTRISNEVIWDHGICAQTMLLGAVEMGYGGCIIGAVDKKGLRSSLLIPEHFRVELVLALGKPRETVVVDPVGADGDIKYWRDDSRVHHVPKRSLDELILDL
ncbi:MAG TPA: nitroreductase family protein [Spirochaetota bacterium]|nr:nitroreductase family protein [Spirochaetota bacterium]HPI88901.1 nitroreductase family protein [Spirochaetota bacterium]HPR46969.1 nitroreductase family protein [Spirochaetota bacterium]